MKRLLVILLVLVIVAAAAALFIPASVAESIVARFGGGAVRLVQADGTIWRGRAFLASSSGEWRMPIGWQLKPASLLTGEPALELLDNNLATAPRGTIRKTAQGVEFQRLSLLLPGFAVDEALKPTGVRLGGEFAIEAQDMSWPLAGETGRLRIDWRNARLSAPDGSVIDLGQVNADLASRGSVLAGPIKGQGRDVALAGELTVDATRLRAKVRLVPSADAPPLLRQALGAIGPADPDGSVTANIDRPLRR